MFPVCTIDRIDPIDRVDPIERIDPIDPIDAIDRIDQNPPNIKTQTLKLKESAGK